MEPKQEKGKEKDTGKEKQKDFSTAIMDKKLGPGRLIVDEATNDDNSVAWYVLSDDRF